jgi:hypothetical protein
MTTVAISKFKEQSGNVYENKGSLWKIPERSWNLIENKGTFRFTEAFC